MLRLWVTLAALVVTAGGASPPNQAVVGDLRVTALSATVLRVEPKGPKGFEDRTTFMVVDRQGFEGIPITVKSDTPTATTLTTASYDIQLIKSATPPTPPQGPTCAAPAMGTDVSGPARSQMFGDGAKADTRADCCANCAKDPSCIAVVYASSSAVEEEAPVGDVPGANCWPLASFSGQVKATNREFACMGNGSQCTGTQVHVPPVIVTSPSGAVLYNSTGQSAGPVQCGGKAQAQCTAPCFWDKDAHNCVNQESKNNLLHWPSPMTTAAYALVDYPRFFAPEWGPTPIPSDATVDPSLVATNGYDFTNNVNGDVYIFLLGDDLDSWNAARAEFVRLAGPCPVLPDFAFGTWFTWWNSYSEPVAKSEVQRWRSDKLPIDVWALDVSLRTVPSCPRLLSGPAGRWRWGGSASHHLFTSSPHHLSSPLTTSLSLYLLTSSLGQMNWRNTSNHQDWYYNHPNTNLFPNFTEWFQFLRDEKLRTYFNVSHSRRAPDRASRQSLGSPRGPAGPSVPGGQSQRRRAADLQGGGCLPLERPLRMDGSRAHLLVV